MRRPVEGPNSHDNRYSVRAPDNERSVYTGWARDSESIDGFLEERPSVGIANKKPPVLDLDVIGENGLGRGIHVGDKSTPVQCNRRHAHRSERGGGGRSSAGGDLDQAPGERSKKALFLSADRVHV